MAAIEEYRRRRRRRRSDGLWVVDTERRREEEGERSWNEIIMIPQTRQIHNLTQVGNENSFFFVFVFFRTDFLFLIIFFSLQNYLLINRK